MSSVRRDRRGCACATPSTPATPTRPPSSPSPSPGKVSGDNPYQLECDLPETLVLVAGVYQTEAEREKLERLLQVDAAEQALNETKQWVRAQTSPMELQTPEPALNHYITAGQLYQTIACRLFAPGGAVPVRRWLRLPGSTSGRGGTHPHLAGAGTGTDPALLRPSV